MEGVPGVGRADVTEGVRTLVTLPTAGGAFRPPPWSASHLLRSTDPSGVFTSVLNGAVKVGAAGGAEA